MYQPSSLEKRIGEELKACTCKQCGGHINKETDEELCGYNRCMKCCRGTCGHSIHYNPKVMIRGKDGFLVNKLKHASEVNKQMSEAIFGKR